MSHRRPGWIGWLAAALALGSAAAAAHGPGGPSGGHGGGHGGGPGGYYPPYRYGGWAPAPYWGGVAIGIGVGSVYYGGRYGYGYGYGFGYPYPGYPGYGVVVAAPPVVYYEAPAQPPAPAAPAPPEPVIYPRNGQSAEQTEADRRDCNRWATTQPNAIADAAVFQRATLACMDGRGYTVK